MPRACKTAAEILNGLADRVLDYIEERNRIPAMRWSAPTSTEIRQFLGRVSGRPTGMTEVILRVLEQQGRATLKPVGNGEYTVHVKSKESPAPVPTVSS